jgi:hypothetical protein
MMIHVVFYDDNLSSLSFGMNHHQILHYQILHIFVVVAYIEALFYIMCLMLGVSSPPRLKGDLIFELSNEVIFSLRS